MKLFSSLFLFIIIVSGSLILVINLYFFQTFNDFAEFQVNTRYQNLVDDSIETISQKMLERYADVAMLSDVNHPIMTQGSIQEKLNLLKVLERSHKSYASFSLYDLSGTKVLDTRNIDFDTNVSEHKFFNSALGGEIYYDDVPIFSPSLNQHVIRFSAPVFDQNRNISYVLLTQIPPFQINSIINTHLQDMPADLANKDGILIYSNYDKSNVGKKIPSFENLLKSTEINEYYIFKSEEKKHLGFEGNKWMLFLKISKESMVSEIIQRQIGFIFFSTVLVIFATLGAFYFSKSITRPIVRLQESTKQVSKDLPKNSILVTGSDEIRSLGNSFNLMIKSIQDYNKSLEDLNTLVNNSVEVSKTDSDGNIIYVNEQFCNTSKYSKDELFGKNHRILKSGYHSSQFFQQLWKTISQGKIWQGEIKNKDKNGDLYWVKTTIMPFLDSRGTPYQYMSIRANITEQKETQERLNLALREIQQHELIIEEQLEEITKIDKQKNEFASMVSHELKSPLLPILGYCEILMESNINTNLTPEQKEAIEEINKSAEHLNRIVQDVLDAQRLEMNKLSFVYVKFFVSELLNEVYLSYLPVMNKKQITWRVSCQKDFEIDSDKSRIRQVLDNLIRNAVDFVESEKGLIQIEAKDYGKQVMFYVKNNGAKIPKETQKHLFKKFYQLDATHTRDHGGTGVGLVICKGIVESLGGQIWVKSSDRETAFYFTISKQQET